MSATEATVEGTSTPSLPLDASRIISSTSTLATSSSSMEYKLIQYADLSFGKLLGEGSDAKVFQGTWQGKTVAIKAFKRGGGSDQKKVREEADIMAKVGSDYIVQLHGFCESSLNYYLVMECMPKGDLDKLLSESGQALSWIERYHIALDVSKGLKALHEVGILHRDVSSLNVFIDNKHHAKLGDFGAAKTLVGSSDTCRELTPEVIARQEKASDIGGLSTVLRALIGQEESCKDFSLTKQQMEQKQKETIPAKMLFEFKALIDEMCQPALLNRPTAHEIVERLERLGCLLQAEEEKQKKRATEMQTSIQAMVHRSKSGTPFFSKSDEKPTAIPSHKRKRVAAENLQEKSNVQVRTVCNKKNTIASSVTVHPPSGSLPTFGSST